MKTFTKTSLALATLAMATLATAAPPSADIKCVANTCTVTMTDMGIVFVNRAPLPGLVTYKGHRAGDLSASFAGAKNAPNEALAQKMKFFARIAGTNGAEVEWVEDADIAVNGIPMRYDGAGKMTFSVQLPGPGNYAFDLRGMLPDGTLVAAYQPATVTGSGGLSSEGGYKYVTVVNKGN